MAKRKSSEVEFTIGDTPLAQDPRFKEWVGMPSYVSENLKPFSTIDIELMDGKAIHVHFESKVDEMEFRRRTNTAHDVNYRKLDSNREAFAAIIDQTVTDNTKYVWHPDVPNMSTAHLRYVEDRTDTQWNPKYPIYIISKGRHESRLTAKALERMNIPYHIVVEPQEVDAYSNVIDFDKVIQLPFSNLGRGSIPARNFVWQHAIDSGAERHWILDDNIRGFFRLHKNQKIEVTTGAIFRAAEDFVDRYENVGIAGFNYYMFAKVRDYLPPYLQNRRIYSCILIKNDLDLRMPADGRVPECVDPHWRGRYNEDTDFSIRAMKQKWCTILFYTFLCYKEATMTMKGGNMDELYQGDGRLTMAQSLVDQHPDITTIYHKFGTAGGTEARAQHLVDYSVFNAERIPLRLKQQFIDNPIPEANNEYNMILGGADGSSL